MRMKFCYSVQPALFLALVVGSLQLNNGAFLLTSEITMSSWVGTSLVTYSRNEIQCVLVF